MRNKIVVLTVKYSLMTLMLILLYALQTTPSLFALWGVRPVLLIPAAVAIAMTEGEFAGGVFGAFCGLLCDLGSQTLFGFNGLILLLCCTGVGLLTIYLMRPSWRSALLYTAAVALLRGLIDFFFSYGMWGYEGVSLILLRETLPVAAYTTAVAPLFYLGARWYRAKADLLLDDGQG
ncbi:MAG: rod shape-determining protein MreD [Oscillospiraceae bacterium]|nr:rod shape-determining protein MreD [Oscillospiraceae bacterium]